MKKTISFIMIIILLLCAFPLNAFGLSVDENKNTVIKNEDAKIENEYNKIHFYFDNPEHTVIDNGEELSEAVKSINGFNENTENDPDEYIQITVGFESDYFNTETYKSFSKERESLKNSNDVLEFRKKVTDYSQRYHYELLKNKIDVLSNLDYKKIEIVKYSPFVVMDVDPTSLEENDLSMLCAMEDIESITISRKLEVTDTATWSQSLATINAMNVVSLGNLTGEGVRIGVYESGVCDTTHINLSDKEITVRNSTANVTPHATVTTSIMALMAPDAKFFASNVVRARDLSWFIDNYCDIVNCSFSVLGNTINSDGIYTKGVREYRYDIDAVYDYQINAHFFTVCVASGNKVGDVRSDRYNPDGEIASPGYAYNAITVGGVNLKNFGNETHWAHEDNACYESRSARNCKPNISAPYEFNVPNMQTYRGTSIASPLVTGAVALLEDDHSFYRTYPELVKSVLISTANKTYDYAATDNNFDKKVGAGIVDLEALLDNNNHYAFENTNRVANTEIASVEIYLVAGDTINIGLAWLVTADSENEIEYLTNYNLKLIGSNHQVQTALVATNTEILRHQVVETGLYRIVVYQRSTMDANVSCDLVALTYEHIYG